MDEAFLGQLKFRFETAEAYLISLEKFVDCEWPALYNCYLAGQFSSAEIFALIHPDRYLNYEILQEDVCHKRVFPHGRLRHHEKCGAALLWGYECNNQTGSNVHADHLFPYSLGGMTSADNLLYLCQVHNRIKAADVHVYPWERAAPFWLDTMIIKINKFVITKI